MTIYHNSVYEKVYNDHNDTQWTLVNNSALGWSCNCFDCVCLNVCYYINNWCLCDVLDWWDVKINKFCHNAFQK